MTIYKGRIEWFLAPDADYPSGYYGDQSCEVKIDGNKLVISAPGTNDFDRITYIGNEEGAGHYQLWEEGNSMQGPHATLHCFKDSKRLEGYYRSSDDHGMWRVTLYENE